MTWRNLIDMEKLVPRGVIFKDAYEYALEHEVKQEVRELVDRYYPREPGYAEILYYVSSDLNRLEVYEYVRDAIMDEGIPQDEFEEWLKEQFVKCEIEDIREKKRYAWYDWNLDEKVVERIGKLGALEYKIMEYTIGTMGPAMTAEEIAALPDFQCSPDYIMICLEYVDYTLGIEGGSLEGLRSRCAKMQDVKC